MEREEAGLKQLKEIRLWSLHWLLAWLDLSQPGEELVATSWLIVSSVARWHLQGWSLVEIQT